MLIEFDQAVVATPQAQVLHGVSLRLSERRVGVIGPNGAGKSTLARLVNGLALPSSGRVLVDGLDTRNQVKDVRRRVGFVFQNPENQIVFPIVREDLAFGLKKQGLAPAERQLVAMASVLVMAPQLVVFDEPTTQLDLRNRNRVAEAIAALPQQAIVVSHDLDLLAGYDRVLAVVDGRIAADGEPAAVLGWYREHCA